MINDLINQVREIGNHYGQSMVLIPSDNNRDFYMSYNWKYGFYFTEESGNPAVTILGWSTKPRGQILLYDLADFQIKKLLKDLFNHNYLTGDYHPL